GASIEMEASGCRSRSKHGTSWRAGWLFWVRMRLRRVFCRLKTLVQANRRSCLDPTLRIFCEADFLFCDNRSESEWDHAGFFREFAADAYVWPASRGAGRAAGGPDGLGESAARPRQPDLPRRARPYR